MKKKFLLILVWLLSVVPVFSSTDYTLPNEVAELAASFKMEVGNNANGDAYKKAVEQEVIRLADGRKVFSRPQYLVFVDRNPAVQLGAVVYLDPNARYVFVVGVFPVSTGDAHRRGHFETPVGTFRNSPENMSYRARGTKNSEGWRGLGGKGSRVWDFGWQATVRGAGEPMKIRMLIHATDPDFGEPHLGTVDSKGCIHVSAKVNAFLDRHGILDASYENGLARAKSVLLKNRVPALFAGEYLVISDSSEK